jgi:hypothetical protein
VRAYERTCVCVWALDVWMRGHEYESPTCARNLVGHACTRARALICGRVCSLALPQDASTTLVMRTVGNTERVFNNAAAQEVLRIEREDPGNFAAFAHLVKGENYRVSFQQTGPLFSVLCASPSGNPVLCSGVGRQMGGCGLYCLCCSGGLVYEYGCAWRCVRAC